MDRMKALLEKLDLQDQVIEEYCQIETVEVDKINDTWTFFLIFEKVIPIMHFRNFINKLENLTSYFSALKKVDFQISFIDEDGEILDYYDYAIDRIANDDKRVLPLKDYEKDIDEKTIKLYVPKGAVSPQIYRSAIESEMKKLGFDVEIEIQIDDSKDSIEEEIKKNNDIFVKESRHILNSEQVKYVFLNNNNDFEDFSDISSIPKTEIELEEFKERNSGKSIIFVEGIVVDNEINDSNSNSSVKLIVTDGVDSIYLNKRKTKPTDLDFFKDIEEGMGVKAKCYANFDSYFNEVTLNILNIARSETILDNNRREDNFENKRVELHLHTKMSAMDGVNKIEDYVDRATSYGHQAIGVSDHGSVQSFPTMEKYVKNKPIKPLYGLEMVYVNDERVRCFNLSQGATSYLWDFGDGDTSKVKEPFHRYMEEGVYDITLWAYSENGCTDVYKLSPAVTVEPVGELRFASVFTPNKTGPIERTDLPTGGTEVDMFFYPPIRQKVLNYKLQVFNRWGVLIFESHDIHTPWNGYYQGELCPQGVYVWYCEGKYSNGKPFKMVGNVTLLQ